MCECVCECVGGERVCVWVRESQRESEREKNIYKLRSIENNAVLEAGRRDTI